MEEALELSVELRPMLEGPRGELELSGELMGVVFQLGAGMKS